MSRVVKRRLLITLVLVSLLVLLAPAWFRSNDRQPLVSSESIAPLSAPAVPTFIEALNDNPPWPSVAKEPEPIAVDQPGKPGLDANGVLKAWSLRLATFSDKRNAERLQRSLQAQGHAAYMRSFMRGADRPLYRVYIGPEVRRQALLTLRKTLQKERGLSGTLVRYVP